MQSMCSSKVSYNPTQINKEYLGKLIVPIRKIVTDIKGQLSVVPACKKDKYFQIFTEKDTKFVQVYSMSTKSDALINLN